MSEKYLLDTHAAIYWSQKQSMSQGFIEFLNQHSEDIRFSWISVWEIGLLAKKGRVAIRDVERWAQEFIEKSGVSLLSPTFKDVSIAMQLPDHHKDPFDRLLIAQALNHHLTLISKDSLIPQYNIKMIWE